MSFTKRLLFENDPSLDSVRARLRDQFDSYRQEFPFRIAGRRKARGGTPRYWDPMWPACLSNSAKALCIETLNINDGVFVRTEQDRAALLEAAEAMWSERRPSAR